MHINPMLINHAYQLYLTWCECCGDLIREELVNGQLNVAHVTGTTPLHLQHAVNIIINIESHETCIMHMCTCSTK